MVCATLGVIVTNDHSTVPLSANIDYRHTCVSIIYGAKDAMMAPVYYDEQYVS